MKSNKAISRANADLAAKHQIPLDVDFHALSSATVERILAAADEARYRKPRDANGSRARHFHAKLQRDKLRAEPKRKRGGQQRGKERRKRITITLEPSRARAVADQFGNGVLSAGIDAMFELLQGKTQ